MQRRPAPSDGSSRNARSESAWRGSSGSGSGSSCSTRATGEERRRFGRLSEAVKARLGEGEDQWTERGLREADRLVPMKEGA